MSDDRYHSEEHKDQIVRRHEAWLENSRTRKWVKMIGPRFERWERSRAKLRQKRIRKGIPEALRGRVWCHLLESDVMMAQNPGVYRQLVNRPNAPCPDAILRDIGRTFPKHAMFASSDSMGQNALTNVLHAYSLYDPQVGYCQGMGFVTALWLSYMPEEQCFWHLVSCLTTKPYALAEIFRPGMPKITEVLYVFEHLVVHFYPTLGAHFEQQGLSPTMYAAQWFITLYTYNFPFEFVTRVWDIFQAEGWKIIFRIALALLREGKDELLGRDFEHLMAYFHDLPTTVDASRVFKRAFQIPLKTKQIQELEQQYQHSLQK